MRENQRDVRLCVARNVKRWRHLRELSQERLAELAGTSNKHVSEVERGRVNTTIDKLARIAAGLSVNIAELFRTTPASTPERRIVLFTERELGQIEQALLVVARKTKRAAQRHD
jgi:transcriptional regulator with XRE-family HTH domain